MVLLVPIINVIDMILGLYWWVVIISVIMSWLVQFGVINTHNRFVDMVGPRGSSTDRTAVAGYSQVCAELRWP